MFKCMAIDLNTQPMPTHDLCTQKCQVAGWWFLLPQRSSSESTGDVQVKFFMYVAFLQSCRPAQIWWMDWIGMMAAHSTSVHVNCFSYFSWHTWWVCCFEGCTQTLTSVHPVLKLTSTWSASTGLNLPSFTWHTLQHMATAGKHGVYHEHFPNIVCQDYHTFASVYCGLWETGTFAMNRPSTVQGQSVGIFEPIRQSPLHCCQPCI
jgi:hypothetical protein